MYRISKWEQNTTEWLTQDRLGKITGSILSKVVTRSGAMSKSVDEVVNRAVAELIMQMPDETFQSDSMLRGKELEEQALKHFNFVYDYEFKKCGFVEAVNVVGESRGYGFSPDAIETVSDNKIKTFLELKCPEAHTHLSYLSSEELPDKYFQQVQMPFAVVEDCEKGVFGSYHPMFPCFRVEVPRDEKFIKLMKPIVEETCGRIKEKYLAISKRLEIVA